MNNPAQKIFLAVTVVVAFIAGNALMKWYQSRTPAAVVAQSKLQTYRPGFTLPDLSGVERNVAEWDGKVLIVNFWATWCPPCRREMPSFVELHEKYAARGVQFVGIALDDDDKVKDFIDTMGVEYPNLLGGNRAIKVSDAYGNSFGALPYTAIIDRTGMIASTHRGEITKSEVESIILKLL